MASSFSSVFARSLVRCVRLAFVYIACVGFALLLPRRATCSFVSGCVCLMRANGTDHTLVDGCACLHSLVLHFHFFAGAIELTVSRAPSPFVRR